MKILVLTSRFPYPLEKGDKLRVYHQIKYLSISHDLVLVSLSDKKVRSAHLEELEKLCSAVYVFKFPRWWGYTKAMLGFLLGGSLQIGYFHHFGLALKIRKIIYREKPDHIFCQLIRMSKYLEETHHVPKTLDYMDAFSVGMLRRANDAPWWQKGVFKLESKRLAAYEAKIYHDFDNATIISEQDRDLLEIPEKEDIAVIRNGVDTEQFKPNSSEKKIDLLFVGNMQYYPNVKAATYLVEQVFPPLQKLIPGIQLTIAGANPTVAVEKLKGNDVEVLGWVDDVSRVYQSAKLFVAPLFHGSGLQNKILEAMSCGVPVVTTTMTNNAIGAKAGESICLADDVKGFCDGIQNLLEDTQHYNEVKSKARTFVAENYSWATYVQQMQDLIEKA